MDSTYTPAVVGILGIVSTLTLSDINALVGVCVGILSLVYLIIRIVKEWRNKNT